MSPDTARALSVLWTLALVGFFLFIAMNFAGLLLSPAYIVPGIRGISPGQNTNQDLTAGSANWSFQALNASTTTGTYAASGGNPGGYLAMTLPGGSIVGGEWVQTVQISGSAPFIAAVHLDYRAQTAGRLVISVESAPQGLNYGAADAIIPVSASASWANTSAIDVSNSVGEPGTYYLKVAFLATFNAAPAQVDLDNLRMAWTTDAAFYFYLPPLLLLYISQDQGQFLAYYGFLVAVIVLAGVWYLLKERRSLVRAFTVPLDNLGARLRSMSAWVAVAQVWLATTFFSLLVIYLLTFLGAPLTSPVNPTPVNGWTVVFQLTAASVFEEVAFRLLLIGVPMALGALLLRVGGGMPITTRTPDPGRPSRSSAWRYLWGGLLRRESPREARLVAAILIFASSVVWALAHAQGGGWGWWKVVPVFIAGLGEGYVFVRHGIGASILLHFATDGSLALSLEGIGGDPLVIVTNLFYLGLAIAGAGFFAWYILYGWEEFQDLRRSYGARIVRQPAAATNTPPADWGSAPPPAGTPGPAYPYAPPPPPPSSAPAPPPSWSPPPGAAPVARGGAQLPQGYAPTYHPPPYGYPPVRFQCPYCGWVEARYENRVFTCLRCGRTA